MAILSGLSATWFCHSDLGNDAWSGAEMDSAKASFGGAIAVADSGDTILACGRNFEEQVFTLTPLSIRAWPDSARWKLTYDSTGYTMEGPFRVHGGSIAGFNALKLTGDMHFIDDCSLKASQYYMLYLYQGSSCTLLNVNMSGTSTNIMFIFKTPYLHIGGNCRLTRSAVSTTYGFQWSCYNIPIIMTTAPVGFSPRKRYWLSSRQTSVWFKP